MNFSTNEEGKKPRKRFLVRKAAELVRSVKLNRDAASEATELFISTSARKFNDLFSGRNYGAQPQ